jgi:4-amino-4-deoxy-L-arabinose transferase-like glycosyltransferase
VKALTGLALVALAVRIGAAVTLDGFLSPDLSEYDLLARNMLAGRGFVYPHLNISYYSYIAPLPAWISAASYWVADSLAPAMIVQIVAGAMLTVVTACVAARLFGSNVAALAAGLLVAIHPGLVVYSAAKMHSLAFDSLFFSGALLQSLRLGERLTVQRAVGLGLIVGLGVLSRATIMVFLPIAGIWLLVVTSRQSRIAVVKYMAIVAIAAAAVIAPWIVRNSLLHRQFVSVVTTDAEVFWRGNNPNASGSAYVDAHHTVLSLLPESEREDLYRQPDELAQAEWFRSRAFAFIRANPAAFVRRTTQKFRDFWWFTDRSGLLYPRTWLIGYKAYYVGIVLFATAGVWVLARGGSAGPAFSSAVLLGVFVLSIALLQSLYYVEGRHRWAIEPMIIALSGGGVAALSRWRWRSSAETRPA